MKSYIHTTDHIRVDGMIRDFKGHLSVGAPLEHAEAYRVSSPGVSVEVKDSDAAIVAIAEMIKSNPNLRLDEGLPSWMVNGVQERLAEGTALRM